MQNNQITELITQDTAEQSELLSINEQIAELETQRDASDDGKKSSSEIVAEQDRKTAQIDRLNRQKAILQKRTKARLPELYEGFKAGTEAHDKAERQFTDDNWQRADAVWQENAEQIEQLKNLLLSIAWLKDSSITSFSEMLESLLEHNNHFERSDTKAGAEKLGHYQASPEQSQALHDSAEILDRELGSNWQRQNAETLERMLNPEPEQLGPVVHHSAVETYYDPEPEPEPESYQQFVRERSKRAGSGGGA